MRKLLWVLFLLPLIATAQKKRPFTETNHAVSFNLPALAQIDYTVLFGYEKKLAPKLFLSAEAGYIFASGYIRDENFSNPPASGFLVRPSLKWFVARNNEFYLQPQAFYKQVTHSVYDWLGKNAVNDIPAYEQLQDFKYRRTIVGMNAVAGFAIPLGWFNNAYLDIYMGLGVRIKKSSVVGEPHSVYRKSSVSIATGDLDNGWYPSLPLGIRFIYAIK